MKPDTSSQTLRNRGIRLTRQRQLLLDLIEASGEHLDAEALYNLAHQRDPKLNRVTVYRTLKLLKEGGLVDELDLMREAGNAAQLKRNFTGSPLLYVPAVYWDFCRPDFFGID